MSEVKAALTLEQWKARSAELDGAFDGTHRLTPDRAVWLDEDGNCDRVGTRRKQRVRRF
jgi:hypothetical protein